MSNQFRIRFVYLAFLCLLSLHAVAQCPITVNAGPDQYVCGTPGTAQLDGDISGDYLNFTWSPLTGMTGSTTLNPTVTVSQTTTYVLRAKAVNTSINLINNGNFEGGNSGFTTDYLFSPGDLVPEGVYDVMPDPGTAHPGFPSCDDHTGGGNMLAVNGNGTPNQDVWCQTIPVLPNTEYAFSAWAMSIISTSPASLQFSINGATIGGTFNVPGTPCLWTQFYTLWNSGGSTSAQICIVNQNTALNGNDFAVDDITYSPVCVVTDTVKVHVVTLAAVAAPANVILPCSGANVTLSGVGSSTGPNVSYEWDTPNGYIVSGANTLNPVVNEIGTYTLTVTYDYGTGVCTKTATVNVILASNQLLASIIPPNPLGCGGNTTLLISTSTQSNVSYQWSTTNGNIVGSSTIKNITVNQPGIYTVLVTNNITGCTATAEITVTSATNPPVANATAAGTVNCIQNTLVLSGAGSSSGPGISYTWNAILGGSITSGQNALNATGSGAGVYTLSVINTNNNCTSVDTVTVSGNTIAPVLTTMPSGVLNCKVDTLTLSATVSPAAATVVWTAINGGSIASGNTTLTPQITAPGQYIITGTNPANGCIESDTITVTANRVLPIAVALPADSLTCQQTNVVLSGTGSSTGPNFSYNWSGGNIVINGNTLQPTVNQAATYTLLVTNSTNFCTATATVQVVADANAITAVANAPDSLDCQINSLVLNALGSSTGAGFTYQWSTSNGVIQSGGNTPNPTVTAGGTYQMLLTNPANGCTATDVAVVVVDTVAPPIVINTPAILTCVLKNVVLPAVNPASGNFTYQWNTSNGNITAGQNTLQATVDMPGSYTLIATNLQNGCASAASTLVLQAAGIPSVVITPPGTLTCAQPTVQLVATGTSGGGTLTLGWTTANGGVLSAGQNTYTPTVSAAGTFTIQITDNSNGCTATATAQVSDNHQLPQLTLMPAPQLNCIRVLDTLSVTGAQPGWQYQWSTSNGGFVSGQNTSSPIVNNAGQYRLTVTDPANGCTNLFIAVVSQNTQAPVLTTGPDELLTCTDSLVNVGSNGISSRQLWTTNNGNIVGVTNLPNASVNAPGTYYITYFNDNNGCVTVDSVLVTVDKAPPSAFAGAPFTLTCAAPVHILNGSASGGTNLQIQWTTTGNISSGGNTPTPTVSQPGTYSLLVTNTNNGCTDTDLVVVAENKTLPTADAGLNDTLSCAVSTLTLTGTALPGATYQYNWVASNGGQITNGPTSLTPVIGAPGTYSITVTDPANGCTITDMVTIFNDANAPVAQIATPAILSCITTQIPLQGSATNGNNLQINWLASNGGVFTGTPNTLNPTVTHTGTYTLVVTNPANGCTDDSSVQVTENIALPTVDAGLSQKLTCTVQNLALSPSVLPINATVVWNTTNGNITGNPNLLTPQINAAGTYRLVATHPVSGCTAEDMVVITIDTLAPAVQANTPGLLTCAQTQIAVQALVTQPAAGNFTASWTTANGHFINGQSTLTPMVDKPGLYILTVQNTQNGCSETIQTTVNHDIALPTAIASVEGVLTCITDNVDLYTIGSSAGSNFQYIWLSGATILPSPPPPATQTGAYILTVRNIQNGCIAMDTVVVAEDKELPVAVLTASNLLDCKQTIVDLDANGSSFGPGFTIDWLTIDGHYLGTVEGLSAQADMPGDYIIFVRNNANGCEQMAGVFISEDKTPPVADAGPDGLLHCNQPKASLTGSSATTGALSFAWDTANGHIAGAANTAVVQADATGTYTLVVTKTSNGCTASDETAVTEVPLPDFDPTVIQPSCLDPLAILEFTQVSGGAAPLQFSFNDGQSFSTALQFETVQSGDYTLIVKDKYGCTAEAEVTVFKPVFPTVSLPQILRIELGDSIQLQPNSTPPAVALAAWQWSPTDAHLSCTDCPMPMANPFVNTQYTLTITDKNGCTATAATIVEVDRRRHVWAPNIFSPNGDGDNDWFTLFGRNVLSIRSLQVYDRWGSKVWEGFDLTPNATTEGWDGTTRSKELTPGVFVWQAVVVFPDGETEVFAGDITLMR